MGIKEIKKEEQFEKVWHEEAKWDDENLRNTCTLHFVQVVPMTDDHGKVVGSNKNEGDTRTSYEELEFNLNQNKLTRKNIKRQISQLRSEIQEKDNILSVRHLPKVKTAKIKELENNLISLNMINEINQRKAKIAQFEKDLIPCLDFIKMRCNTLGIEDDEQD